MTRLKVLLAVVAVVGLLVGILGLGDSIKIFKDDIDDISTIGYGNHEKGQLARGKIDYVFDEVAVEKTTRTYGGVPTGSTETPYYLCYIGNETDGYYFMTVSVGNKDLQKKFETLADQTYAYIEQGSTTVPTPIEVMTKAVEMPDKVETYMNQYCKENLKLTDSEYAEMAETSLVLNTVQFDTMKIIPFAGFGIFLVAGAVFVILIKKSRG